MEKQEILHELFKRKQDNGKVAVLKDYLYNLDNDEVDMLIHYKTSIKDDALIAYPRGELRDNQTLGLAYMYTQKDCLIGDSVGLGKTVQVAALFNYEMFKNKGRGVQFLIFTENYRIAKQFQKEMLKFTGKYFPISSGEIGKLENLNGEIYNLIQKDMYYGCILTHSCAISQNCLSLLSMVSKNYNQGKYDYLIIDESSILQNNTSVSYSGFKIIKKNFANNTILLNATPFEMSLDALYNQLYFILENKGVLPKRTAFKETYCVFDYFTNTYDPLRYKNKEQFLDLIKDYYWATTRRDLGSAYEDNYVYIRELEITPRHKEIIRNTTMKRLAYDCPSSFTLSDMSNNIDTNPKLKETVKILEEEIPENESVMIYIHFKEAQEGVYNTLVDMGYSCVVVNGETPKNKQVALLQQFKEKKYKVLITNIVKGSNLGECNYLIMYTYPTNPSKLVQVEGRLTRSMDVHGKTFYVLLTKGSEITSLKRVMIPRINNTDTFTNRDTSLVLEKIYERYAKPKT